MGALVITFTVMKCAFFSVFCFGLFVLQSPITGGGNAFAQNTQASSQAASTAAEPGAADTQVFSHERARDHFILQRETQSRHLQILQEYADRNELGKLRNALPNFCSASEPTTDCFKRYKRSEARRLEELRGGILVADDQITGLRSDAPRGGGTAVQMGGAITGARNSSEAEANNQVTFNASIRPPASLNAPAYVPTLSELEALQRGQNAQGRGILTGVHSAEQRYILWRQATFENQADRENYSLFTVVTPSAPSPNEATLRALQKNGANPAVDESTFNSVNQSLIQNQNNDVRQAELARDSAVRAINNQEARLNDPAVTLESRLTPEQRQAYNESRGAIITALQDSMRANGGTSPAPSASRSPNPRTPARTPAPPTPPAGSAIRAQINPNPGPAAPGLSNGTPSTLSPLSDDQTVGERLPSSGRYHIYTDPDSLTDEIKDLREISN